LDDSWIYIASGNRSRGYEAYFEGNQIIINRYEWYIKVWNAVESWIIPIALSAIGTYVVNRLRIT
jgi:hypothetical protein